MLRIAICRIVDHQGTLGTNSGANDRTLFTIYLGPGYRYIEASGFKLIMNFGDDRRGTPMPVWASGEEPQAALVVRGAPFTQV